MRLQLAIHPDQLHPFVRLSIAELDRTMNCCYSNLVYVDIDPLDGEVAGGIRLYAN